MNARAAWGVSLLAAAACAPPPDPAPRARPADTGSIEGVVLAGPGLDVEPTRIQNTTDPDVCGESQSLEDVRISEDRGLQNVIVSLTDAPDANVPGAALVLDNVGCRFEPHVATMTIGGTIEATNSDAVLHTTHLYGPVETNFSLPVEGARGSRVLDKAGIYAVKCDVHGWMQAYVRVDSHPYHGVSDADGRFRIEGVPPGTYGLELWHERYGIIERGVTVTTSEVTLIEVEYRP